MDGIQSGPCNEAAYNFKSAQKSIAGGNLALKSTFGKNIGQFHSHKNSGCHAYIAIEIILSRSLR
jgi:hypothetical protein